MHLETILFIAVLSTSDCLTYRNYALLHGIPRNERELKFYNDMAKLYNVTFWKRPGRVKDPVEFTISPFNYAELMIDTFKTKIRFKTIMEDVQSAFDQQTVRRYIRREMTSYTWDNYYGLDDIYNWLKDLSSTHPNEVELEPIGKSIENRDIIAVKLKLNSVKFYNSRHRSKVIVEGGCHGREWLSPVFVTYMIYALLNANHSNSEELKLVAPMLDWYFVPVMNPDGYVYSHTHDRLWKKNRRDGYGVDLNRNFGILFGKQEAKTEKDSDEYCGADPFSEPESAAMASFTRDNSLGLEYYLSFHAFGQYIILPYAFSKTHEDNYNSTKQLAEFAANKMFRKYNVKYEIGTSYDTLGYLASGVSADWVKRAINVTHVASFELPDTGVFGFALPSDRILPACQAIMDGLLAFLDPPNPQNEEVTYLKQRIHDSRVTGVIRGNRASYGIGVNISDEVILLCHFVLYVSDIK